MTTWRSMKMQLWVQLKNWKLSILDRCKLKNKGSGTIIKTITSLQRGWLISARRKSNLWNKSSIWKQKGLKSLLKSCSKKIENKKMPKLMIGSEKENKPCKSIKKPHWWPISRGWRKIEMIKSKKGRWIHKKCSSSWEISKMISCRNRVFKSKKHFKI